LGRKILLAPSTPLLCVMLVSGLLAASAPGEANSDDEAARGSSGELDIGLPGEVYEVRTLGAWRDGSRAGTYRVVTLRGGFDRVQTVVTIQWMEQGLDEEVPSVVAARRVELLDDLGPITVSAVRATAKPNELSLSIPVRNVVSGEAGNVQAVAVLPGQLTADYTAMSKR
jgi:hypothetical protein